jgi:hypothetical protein
MKARQNTSPVGRGRRGLGFAGVDIVPEPFDTASPLRTFGSASGMPSILKEAFKGEL